MPSQLRFLFDNITDPRARVMGALGPAVVLLAYVLGALLVYVVSGQHRRFFDRELESRVTGLSTVAIRRFFGWLMAPFVRALLALELPPNAITTVSLGFSLAAGVAMAAGRFSLGGWLYFAAGSCDFFDGRIARARNIASEAGAALDSIIDRYCESAVLVGLAWYYRESWVLFPTLLALTGSLLVPYVRAKAEALQRKMSDVGWLQRPERIVLLGSTVALSPIFEVMYAPDERHPMHWLAVLGIVILAIGTQTTAAQRTRHLLRLLAGDMAPATPARSAKVLVSSFLATASDAGLVALLSLMVAVRVPLPAATALGCLLGALVNFTLNRTWAFAPPSDLRSSVVTVVRALRSGSRPSGWRDTFDAQSGSMSQQASRYVFVSFTSALLNAGGVAVVALLPNVPGSVAWLLVRGTVFVVWTMPLYRDYVFSSGDEHNASHQSHSLGQ